MKLALVIWRDASGPSTEWHEIPKSYRHTEVRSVGYIIESEDGITLIPNYIPESEHTDELCFGRFDIPRGCVQEIRYLIANCWD